MAILLRAVLLLLRFGLRGLSAALDETMSLLIYTVSNSTGREIPASGKGRRTVPLLETEMIGKTNLQCILSTEAFVAIIARERLDREMYPLMPL